MLGAYATPITVPHSFEVCARGPEEFVEAWLKTPFTEYNPRFKADHLISEDHGKQGALIENVDDEATTFTLQEYTFGSTRAKYTWKDPNGTTSIYEIRCQQADNVIKVDLECLCGTFWSVANLAPVAWHRP